MLKETIFQDKATLNGLDCIMAYIPRIEGATIEIHIVDELEVNILHAGYYKVAKKEPKEMTIQEVCDELGYEIKIVKGGE